MTHREKRRVLLMTTDELVFRHISNLNDGMSQENPLVARAALKFARTKPSEPTTQ
jgi:hypothetical protein